MIEISNACLAGLDPASRNVEVDISWIPASAGMTSRKAPIEKLLRLKARGFNHPRKSHEIIKWKEKD